MKEDSLTKREQFIESAKSDPDLKKFSLKDRIELYALKITMYNVTKAAKMLNIDRSTFYKKAEKNPAYKAMMEEIKDVAIDIVEDKLMENIQANDTASIIFFLKTRAKHRGYVEQVNADVTTKGESVNQGFYEFLKQTSVVEQ